jgi:hypothetical protein
VKLSLSFLLVPKNYYYNYYTYNMYNFVFYTLAYTICMYFLNHDHNHDE